MSLDLGKSLAARLLPSRVLSVSNTVSTLAISQTRDSVDLERLIRDTIAKNLATKLVEEGRGFYSRERIRTGHDGDTIFKITLEVAPPGAFAVALAAAWKEGFDAKDK